MDFINKLPIRLVILLTTVSLTSASLMTQVCQDLLQDCQALDREHSVCTDPQDAATYCPSFCDVCAAGGADDDDGDGDDDGGDGDGGDDGGHLDGELTPTPGHPTAATTPTTTRTDGGSIKTVSVITLPERRSLSR